MKYLTEYYNIIMTAILIVGFAIAIGIIVGMRRVSLKEEQRAEMASKARKVRKFN